LLIKHIIGQQAVSIPFISWSFYLPSDSPMHVVCSQHSQISPILENPSSIFPKCFFSGNIPINSKKHIQQDYYNTLLQKTGRNIKFIWFFHCCNECFPKSIKFKFWKLKELWQFLIVIFLIIIINLHGTSPNYWVCT
jgi:hypothetical protein